MMTAARSSAFHYKKRTNTPVKTSAKKRNGKGLSPSSSQLTLSSIGSQNSLCANSLTVPAMRKRSGSVPALKTTTLAATWNLKTEHVRALRTTWARLCEPPRSNCKGIVNLVERVWERIDNKNQSVRHIFYHAAFIDSMHDRCERRRSGSIATLRDHTHFFVSLVSQVVQSLDVDPQGILDHLEEIGRNHAHLRQYGFKSSLWEKVGEYFIDIVVIQDCVRGFPEACKAWTLLIAAVIDKIRSAPRRGSITPAGSMVNVCPTSFSVSPRRGSMASVTHGSQSSLGSASGGCGLANMTNPVCRTVVQHPSTPDLTAQDSQDSPKKDPESECLNMKNIATALPEVLASNPALA